MMVLWEHESLTVKELGEYLYLDSGTLTPVLKKLEAKGLLTRHRSKQDERSLIVTISDKGRQLQDDAVEVPEHITQCVNMPQQDFEKLYSLLYEVLNSFREEQ